MLFGYDMFISYRHRDGRDHAARLEVALVREGYIVFRDVEELPPGAELEPEVVRGLKRARMLIVVGTPGVLDTDAWVPFEVETFAPSGRPIVVLDVDEALKDSSILLVERVWIPDTEGGPSIAVVDQVKKAVTFVKRARLARWLLASTALLFAALVGAATNYANEAEFESRQRAHAEADAVLNSAAAMLKLDPTAALAQAGGVMLPEVQLRRWTIEARARALGVAEQTLETEPIPIADLAVSPDSSRLALVRSKRDGERNELVLYTWSERPTWLSAASLPPKSGAAARVVFLDSKHILTLGSHLHRWRLDDDNLTLLSSTAIESDHASVSNSGHVAFVHETQVTIMHRASRTTRTIPPGLSVSTLKVGVQGATVIGGQSGEVAYHAPGASGFRLLPSAQLAKVSCLAMMADKFIAASDVEGRMVIWSLTGEDRVPKSFHESRFVKNAAHWSDVRALRFSANGKFLISVSETDLLRSRQDHAIRIWDVQTGQLRHGPLRGHNQWVAGPAVLSDGRILTGDGEGEVRVWSSEPANPPIPTAGLQKNLPDAESYAKATFVDDTKLVVASCADGCGLGTIDTATKRFELRSGELLKDTSLLSHLKWRPPDVHVGARGYDVSMLGRYNLRSLKGPEQTLPGALSSADPTGAMQLIVQGDFTELVDEGQTRLQLRSANDLFFIWSPAGERLAAIRRNKVEIYDRSGKKLAGCQLTSEARSGAFGAHCNELYLGGADGYVYRQDLATCALTRSALRHGGQLPSTHFLDDFNAYQGPARDVAALALIDSDEAAIVSAGQDGALRFWDDRLNSVGVSIPISPYKLDQLTLSPSQKNIVATDLKGQLFMLPIEGIGRLPIPGARPSRCAPIE